MMMIMMILLLNRYGHKPIVSKFLVIDFGFSDALVLDSLFHVRNFCLVLFHDVSCCLD
jgi:hypothetical protein